MVLGWLKYPDGNIYLVGFEDGEVEKVILAFDEETFGSFKRATLEFSDKISLDVPSVFKEAFDEDT